MNRENKPKQELVRTNKLEAVGTSEKVMEGVAGKIKEKDAVQLEEEGLDKTGWKKKFGDLIKVFTGASMLSFSAPATSEAFKSPEINNKNIKIQEDLMKKEQVAVEFIHKLCSLPDNPEKDDSENYKMKSGIASVLLHYEATRRTDGTIEAVDRYKKELAKITLADKKIDGNQRNFIMGVLASR